MIKTTGAMDRIIAIAAGITAHTKIHSANAPEIVSGRQIASVRAAAKRGLVKITAERTDGVRKFVQYELTDLGLERALELEELHADKETGIIPMLTLINL
jgi:hypothetical protein